MIITVDVGNTSTHFGLFQGEKMVKEWRLATTKLSGHLPAAYTRLSSEQVIVSSVVPRVNQTIRRWFPKAKFVNFRNIGIKIRLNNPSEVGADRLVNALAAYTLYKGPCIVVDFGTATTFDVISKTGEYLGGAIAPGVLLSRDCLHSRTAKLPLIEIKSPRRVIGKNTREAMRSGLVFGYVAMVEGMIERIKSKIQNPKSKNRIHKIKVIATGGLAELICKYTKVVDRIDSKLTLKGLNYVGRIK